MGPMHQIATLNRAGWIIGMLAAILYAGGAISRGVFYTCVTGAVLLWIVAWRRGNANASR